MYAERYKNLVGTVAVVLAVVLSVFFVVVVADAATTISTNIVTGGAIDATSTLAVGGLSTLAGFISTASSTVDGDFNVGTGYALTASSTLHVGGLSTLAGFISTASSTVGGDFNVGLGGALTASSTFMVDGLATFAASGDFTGGLTRQNEIWTYNSAGNIVSTTSLPIVTSSNLGVNGSTTPAFALGVDGDIIASTTQTTSATSTLILDTNGSSTGGCIQMKDTTGGTTYKITILASTTGNGSDTVELQVVAGTCKGS